MRCGASSVCVGNSKAGGEETEAERIAGSGVRILVPMTSFRCEPSSADLKKLLVDDVEGERVPPKKERGRVLLLLLTSLTERVNAVPCVSPCVTEEGVHPVGEVDTKGGDGVGEVVRGDFSFFSLISRGADGEFGVGAGGKVDAGEGIDVNDRVTDDDDDDDDAVDDTVDANDDDDDEDEGGGGEEGCGLIALMGVAPGTRFF